MEKIFLFYKYVNIKDPEAVKTWQLQLCTSLQLTGRIILAHEGINGTLAGSIENLQKYSENMNRHDLFNTIDFKESSGSTQDFPKLKIIIKNEIVRMAIDPTKITVDQAGEHLSPKQAHALIEQNKDLVLLDGRNDYESRIGTFKNAITPSIQHFRDFPDYIDTNAQQFKDKEVLMFCTGGIRCERASAYLKSKNVAKKVYQLKGGIHRYVEKFPDGHFRGKNYVFDARIALRVNDDILAYCDGCNAPCDDYINCRNARCNKQCIMCKHCIDRLHNTCSLECCDLIVQGNAPKRPIKFKNHVV
jgi:predicted sulfurtransferase